VNYDDSIEAGPLYNLSYYDTIALNPFFSAPSIMPLDDNYEYNYYPEADVYLIAYPDLDWNIPYHRWMYYTYPDFYLNYYGVPYRYNNYPFFDKYYDPDYFYYKAYGYNGEDAREEALLKSQEDYRTRSTSPYNLEKNNPNYVFNRPSITPTNLSGVNLNRLDQNNELSPTPRYHGRKYPNPEYPPTPYMNPPESLANKVYTKQSFNQGGYGVPGREQIPGTLNLYTKPSRNKLLGVPGSLGIPQRKPYTFSHGETRNGWSGGEHKVKELFDSDEIEIELDPSENIIRKDTLGNNIPRDAPENASSDIPNETQKTFTAVINKINGCNRCDPFAPFDSKACQIYKLS
jgi:hypothetical protein